MHNIPTENVPRSNLFSIFMFLLRACKLKNRYTPKRALKLTNVLRIAEVSPAIIICPNDITSITKGKINEPITEPMIKNGRATIIRVDPEPNVNKTPEPQPFASCIPKPKIKAPNNKDKFTGA